MPARSNASARASRFPTSSRAERSFTDRILRAEFVPYIRSAKLGVNTALEDLLWNFGNLMIIRILNTIDEKAAGIYSMVFTVEVIFVVIIGAMGNGTLTLSGEATGAKDLKLYRKIVLTALKWSCLISAAALIFVSIFPRFSAGVARRYV